MASFYRYRPVLSGFAGGPGINTWHFEETLADFGGNQAQAIADIVREIYFAIRTNLVAGTSVTFPAEVTIHNELTGALVDVKSVTPPVTVVSSSTVSDAKVSRATQAIVRLHTDQIRRGRRLQGRHFIGPLSATAMDQNGQITGAVQTAIATAYDGALDWVDGRLVVWGPPIEDENDNVVEAGVKGTVQSVSVNALPGTLRSRKE